MASSVIISYPGPPEQKQTAKVTAMQPLSAVLPGVCAKFRPALDPASVRLTLNKKPVDVDVPFRLANIPSGSILVVSSSRPAAAAPPPQPAAAAATAGTDAAEAAPPATAAPAPIPTPVPPPSAEAPQPPTLPSPIHPTAQPQEAQPVAATEQQQPALAPPPQQPTLAPAPQQHVPSPPAAPLVDLLQLSTAAGLSPPREALLTTEAALQQQQHRRLHQHDAPGGAGASSGGGAMEVEGGANDEDDAFYELTPEDLAGMFKAQEARRKEETQGLKTQAMREAEERARLQAYGPVALRLRFRDGVVVQARFAATDTIRTVQGFVQQLVDPASLGKQGVALFTAPPKQVLKDDAQMLFKAGLVPAALVHVQLPASAAGATLGVLKPAVAACLVSSLALEQPLPGLPQHADAAKPAAAEQGGAAGAGGAGTSSSSAAVQAAAAAAVAASRAASRQAQPQAGGEGRPALPKWFKR